jgi:hypothetical protein
MTQHLRWVLGGALTLVSGLGSGCRPCDEQETVELSFAPLKAKVDQTVVVRLRHRAADEPSITCSWGSTTTTPGPRWTCSPKADNEDAENALVAANPGLETHLYFSIPDPGSTWLVEIAGPSDTQTLTRTPFKQDAGEESCAGPNFLITLTTDDLSAVGAVTG